MPVRDPQSRKMVPIPSELHHRLKIASARSGKTMSRLAAKAIENSLAFQRPEPAWPDAEISRPHRFQEPL